MIQPDDPFELYVEHPRFGNRPRITGLDPRPGCEGVYLGWRALDDWKIPGTAIVADLSRQTPATVPVTHYFDLKRICRDCGRPFLFFAEEQKHWYEELGFGLDSDCVRCPPCRVRQRGIARKRERYEEIFHVQERTTEQNIEMAECCLCLVEAAVFPPRQLERVRMLLNRVPDARRSDDQVVEMIARLRAVEERDKPDK
ncbi:MAG: zinc-ribbon domain-containing protein [Pirellulales bacterium]|nr:zinc-ribbon domain-containing protein [Pirellulales bacterium]